MKWSEDVEREQVDTTVEDVQRLLTTLDRELIRRRAEHAALRGQAEDLRDELLLLIAEQVHAIRAALASTPEPATHGKSTANNARVSHSAPVAEELTADLRAALKRIVTVLNHPDKGFVETIEEVHAIARMALAYTPETAPVAEELDVERLARALRTDQVSRYVMEAWVEDGVNEPGYATTDEMADAIARGYAAVAEELDTAEKPCPQCREVKFHRMDCTNRDDTPR